MYNTKSKPCVNCGLRAIVMCRFIDCNKCTTLDVDSQRDWGWGEVYVNSLYFLLNFAMNLKLLFKKSILK